MSKASEYDVESPADEFLTWASELQFSDLPSAAVEVLRDNLLDGLGCGLFGSTLPATHLIAKTLLSQYDEGGRCSLWGTDRRAAPLDAAVINAAALNGFELDGGSHLVRNVHGPMAVYPVIVAVAELTHDVSGEDLFAAAAAGQEMAVRISKALGPTVMDRGWYGTPIYATLGAAIAAGRALHLSPEQMRGCFELALLHASGLSVTSEEGMGKPLSSGESVRSGLLCAMLAAEGARGPREAYEHKKGFAAAFSIPEERNDDALRIKPGDPLAAANASFKAYASCGASHTTVDLLTAWMDENPAIGPDTVEGVDVRINITSAHHIGGPYLPKDVTNAQFNMKYCVSALLLEKALLADQFRSSLLGDPRILELSERVNVIPDPEVGSRSTSVRNEAYVTLRLTDGTTYEGHLESSADPDRAGLRKKFALLASAVVDDAACPRIVDMVDRLEHEKDATALAELLSQPGAR